jgi:hypothetical protein
MTALETVVDVVLRSEVPGPMPGPAINSSAFSFDSLGVINGRLWGYDITALPRFPRLQAIKNGICFNLQYANASSDGTALNMASLSNTAIQGPCFINVNMRPTFCPCSSGCNDYSACTPVPLLHEAKPVRDW